MTIRSKIILLPALAALLLVPILVLIANERRVWRDVTSAVEAAYLPALSLSHQLGERLGEVQRGFDDAAFFLSDSTLAATADRRQVFDETLRRAAEYEVVPSAFGDRDET